MAEQNPQNSESQTTSNDRGLFDCFGKKEETSKEDVPMEEAQEHKPSLMEKLQRSNSSSSSSSEEEVEEGGVKIRRRRKNGLTDKIKEKLPGHQNNEATAAAAASHQEAAAENPEETHPVEEKSLMEKIKDKIPGQHKEESAAVAPVSGPAATSVHSEAAGQCAGPGADATHDKEKKGFFDKIMEKLPGAHKDGTEAKKEH